MRLTLFMPHRSFFMPHWIFFMRVFFTPVGNFGPNYGNYVGRLMGENGHQSQKWPNSTIKMAIIQNSLLDISLPWEYCPMNNRQIWYNFCSFREIIFFVQGLGQKQNYSWPNEPCWIEYWFLEKLLSNSSARSAAVNFDWLPPFESFCHLI